MFTSVTGFALGLAARRGASAGQAVGPWVLGMIGAIALHAFWNGSAVFGDFFALYLTLQVPAVRRCSSSASSRCAARRRGSPASRLGDYAAAGWFTPQEVDMLATRQGRKAALAWARTLRGDRTAHHEGVHRGCHGARRGAPARDHRSGRARRAKTSSVLLTARPPRAPRCSLP